MATHNLSFAETLLQGSAYYPKYHKDDLQGKRGLPASMPIYVNLGAPAVADPDGLFQSADPANNASLTLRSTVTGQVNSGGVVTLDHARNVTITASGDESTKTLTVTGTDIYGEALVETITGPNNATASGKKAFKTISSMVATGDFGTITVGFGDVLGLPYRITDKNQVDVNLDGANDGATIVVADDTTATATTGDVRGTIDTSGALNGTKKLRVVLWEVDRTSKAGAFGVAQYGG